MFILLFCARESVAAFLRAESCPPRSCWRLTAVSPAERRTPSLLSATRFALAASLCRFAFRFTIGSIDATIVLRFALFVFMAERFVAASTRPVSAFVEAAFAPPLAISLLILMGPRPSLILILFVVWSVILSDSTDFRPLREIILSLAFLRPVFKSLTLLNDPPSNGIVVP